MEGFYRRTGVVGKGQGLWDLYILDFKIELGYLNAGPVQALARM
jgi:hypothetical protein